MVAGWALLLAAVFSLAGWPALPPLVGAVDDGHLAISCDEHFGQRQSGTLEWR